MIEHYCSEHKMTAFECVKCLEADNPWRYPSRGELPDVEGYYLCSLMVGDIRYHRTFEAYWDGEIWDDEADQNPSLTPYAWCELPAPAPVLEEEG